MADIDSVELPEFDSIQLKYIVAELVDRIIIRGGYSDREHERIEIALEDNLRREGFLNERDELHVLGGGRLFKSDKNKFILLMTGSGKYYAADLTQVKELLGPYLRERFPNYDIRVAR